MGSTEWTIIGVAIALFLAFGSMIRFSNSSIRNELKGSHAEVRTEIAEVRTEIAEVRTEIAEVRTEIAEVRTEIAEVRIGIAELRTEVKGDIANVRTEIADLRAELKGDMADLRTELKLDLQANRAEIITNRRMLGRFALHRHGEDGLPLAPLTDTLEPPEGGGDPSGGEDGGN